MDHAAEYAREGAGDRIHAATGCSMVGD